MVNRFIISVTFGQLAVIFDKYRIFSFTDILQTDILNSHEK